MNRTILIVSSLFLLCAGVIYWYLFFGATPGVKTQPKETTKINSKQQITPLPTKYEIDKLYEVKSVDDTTIVLSTEKGEMIVPIHSIGGVFKGSVAEHTIATIEDLAIGQEVTLEVIPEVNVWIYIHDKQ